MTDDWRPRILSIEEAIELSKNGEDPGASDEIVFLTEDMRLKDGILSKNDRLIFKQIRMGQTVPVNITGPIEINTPEELVAEAEGYKERLEKRDMSRDGAALNREDLYRMAFNSLDRVTFLRDEGSPRMHEYVRHLRVERMYTWRSVSAEMCRILKGDWDDNQYWGKDFCAAAAAHFEEDYLKPPWN